MICRYDIYISVSYLYHITLYYIYQIYDMSYSYHIYDIAIYMIWYMYIMNI